LGASCTSSSPSSPAAFFFAEQEKGPATHQRDHQHRNANDQQKFFALGFSTRRLGSVGLIGISFGSHFFSLGTTV
jgi:hypothetical protein